MKSEQQHQLKDSKRQKQLQSISNQSNKILSMPICNKNIDRIIKPTNNTKQPYCPNNPTKYKDSIKDQHRHNQRGQQDRKSKVC